MIPFTLSNSSPSSNSPQLFSVMAGDLVSWIRGDAAKKTGKQALVTVLPQAIPIMKTIQAVQGIVKVGETLQGVGETVGQVNSLLPKVSRLVDSAATNFIPSMQIMAQSFADSVRLATRFQLAATAVGIGANTILTYQGVKALHLIAEKLENISTALHAQTALTAQREFPQYVHDMIRERIGQTAEDPVTEHWFFLYHPDDDWYPKFYHLLERSPVGPAFCGYTNQIDTIFVFMLAARRYISENKRLRKPVRIHLLIPAYQPILIAEALRIPEEIGDFIMEARINSNKEFVWFNLPKEQQRLFTVGIGQWDPSPRTWWDAVLSKVGLSAAEGPSLGRPRVLGTRQGDDEEGIEGVEMGSRLLTAEGENEKVERHNSTPLHTRDRDRRGRRRSHRKSVEAEDRLERRMGRSKRSSSVG